MAFPPQLRAARTPLLLTARRLGAATDNDSYMRSRDRYRLVVFNKDGTLTRFNPLWLRWAQEQAQRLRPLLQADSTKLLYRTLTDFHKRSLHVLAYGRQPPPIKFEEIRQLVLDSIKARNSAQSTANVEASLLQLLEEPRAPLELSALTTTELLPPATNLARLFSALKSRCIRIALSTSDTRANTLSDLRHLKVLGYFDELHCGDDPHLPAKPNAAALLQLCKKMDVQPAEVAVVGDTVCDLCMAEQANAGLRIGALSGITGATELAPYADFLLPNIGFILPLIVNQRSAPIFATQKDVARSSVESARSTARAASCA